MGSLKLTDTASERFATGRGEAAELASYPRAERHGPTVLRAALICPGGQAIPDDRLRAQDRVQASWRFTDRVMLDRWCALVARVTVTPGHDAARAVFFEYAWVTESAFRAGRSKVLQSFLDRTRIYTTDYFVPLPFESAASAEPKAFVANFSPTPACVS